MEGDTISRREHEEFRRRIEEANAEQNRRIVQLETTCQQITSLTVSVQSLAQSIQGMVKEQEKQGKRLEAIEGRDGEMWRKVVGYTVTAVIGIVIGFVFTQIGM
jgi:TolA-binding protein